MTDRRTRNNQSAAQRRQSVYRRRKKRAAPKKEMLLSKAKHVLRRTGRAVFDAQIDSPKFKGLIIVDTRKMTPEAVIEMAELQLTKENLRNNELRKQHGLEPLPLKTLEEI